MDTGHGGSPGFDTRILSDTVKSEDAVLNKVLKNRPYRLYKLKKKNFCCSRINNTFRISDLMFLGGDSDEGEMVCGVQVPHQAAGPLYQLGNLRRVLQIQKVKGTVSRDFLLLVFFMNQFPPSP